MNKENLNKMADYIETIPQDRFDMGKFRTGEYKERECASVGCVLGHCTVIDENLLPIDHDNNIDFPNWSLEFTGLHPFYHLEKWQYLFSSDWSYVDNTPVGAAKRIRHFLEQGLPQDWRMQMIGKAPLSYLNQTK